MNIKYVTEPTALSTLVERHRRNPAVYETARLEFLGVDGFDVYNVSNEFSWKGRRLIAGRVERRESERSAVRFFEKVDLDCYRVLPGGIDDFQDPYATVLDGALLIGGTAIHEDADGRIDTWNTAFYRGDDLSTLVRIADAPAKMKDVRVERRGVLHVFTRPQGGIAGPGRIGYYACDDLSGVNPAAIASAPLLATQFPEGCWGGVNQILPLEGGLLGIVGHIATMSEGDVRHYYGMTFVFDPATRRSTEVNILCERRDFTPGAAKRPDLVDVVFAGGLVRHGNGTATVYVGLSDAEAHAAIVDDPFEAFEKE
ncbi:MAG: DUF1861 family protein [Candidatus Izemoplasmatales bacterium]